MDGELVNNSGPYVDDLLKFSERREMEGELKMPKLHEN